MPNMKTMTAEQLAAMVLPADGRADRNAAGAMKGHLETAHSLLGRLYCQG